MSVFPRLGLPQWQGSCWRPGRKFRRPGDREGRIGKEWGFVRTHVAVRGGCDQAELPSAGHAGDRGSSPVPDNVCGRACRDSHVSRSGGKIVASLGGAAVIEMVSHSPSSSCPVSPPLRLTRPQTASADQPDRTPHICHTHPTPPTVAPNATSWLQIHSPRSRTSATSPVRAAPHPQAIPHCRRKERSDAASPTPPTSSRGPRPAGPCGRCRCQPGLVQDVVVIGVPDAPGDRAARPTVGASIASAINTSLRAVQPFLSSSFQCGYSSRLYPSRISSAIGREVIASVRVYSSAWAVVGARTAKAREAATTPRQKVVIMVW